jgi:hypothetical protein
MSVSADCIVMTFNDSHLLVLALLLVAFVEVLKVFASAWPRIWANRNTAVALDAMTSMITRISPNHILDRPTAADDIQLPAISENVNE